MGPKGEPGTAGNRGPTGRPGKRGKQVSLPAVQTGTFKTIFSEKASLHLIIFLSFFSFNTPSLTTGTFLLSVTQSPTAFVLFCMCSRD